MSKWFCSRFWYFGNAWKTENETYSPSNNTWCRYGLSISFKNRCLFERPLVWQIKDICNWLSQKLHQNTYNMYKIIIVIMKFSFLKQMKFATKNTIQINDQHSDNQISIIIFQSYSVNQVANQFLLNIYINELNNIQLKTKVGWAFHFFFWR